MTPFKLKVLTPSTIAAWRRPSSQIWSVPAYFYIDSGALPSLHLRGGTTAMRLKALEANRPFKVGDRVRLSAFGRTRRPRKTRNSGLVIGYSENGVVVRVVFEGHKTPSRLHASLLELVSVAGAARDLPPARVHKPRNGSPRSGRATSDDQVRGNTSAACAPTRVITDTHLIECLEQIASDHDLVANLATSDESRRHHKLSSRKVRRLVDRIALRRDQFVLEKKIALGSQRIAQQKGLIARLERLGFDSKLARELLVVFEQTQSLFEQHRRHLRQARP
jgi:hypothetical protein